MFESIDIHSSIAVYVQIENLVQFAIASGRLKAGSQLPAIHKLSEQLAVNMNTVAKAYRDLDVMGIVSSKRGAGIFVCEGAEAKCRETCRKEIVGRLHEVVAEARAAGMTSSEIRQVAAKSYASKIGPYGKVPTSILALAKTKGSS